MGRAPRARVSSAWRRQDIEVHLATSIKGICSRIAHDCHTKSVPHTCLNPFRDNPGSVRNWQARRVLPSRCTVFPPLAMSLHSLLLLLLAPLLPPQVLLLGWPGGAKGHVLGE